MKHHEKLPYALIRIAGELETQASKFPNRMIGHISKLIQDGAYLRQAAALLTEQEEKDAAEKN